MFLSKQIMGLDQGNGAEFIEQNLNCVLQLYYKMFKRAYYNRWLAKIQDDPI